jgi:hypothetical protein
MRTRRTTGGGDLLRLEELCQVQEEAGPVFGNQSSSARQAGGTTGEHPTRRITVQSGDSALETLTPRLASRACDNVFALAGAAAAALMLHRQRGHS